MNASWILDIIFPPTCVGCRERIASGVVCTACYQSIAIFKSPDVYAACHYDTPAVQRLVHALKFKGITAAAMPLAQLLIRYVEKVYTDNSLAEWTVMPLPLSQRRMRERGFNQSALIARTFAKHFALPVREDILLRIGHRSPQSETREVAERWENIQGCFETVTVPNTMNGSHAIAPPRKIILIDDVTTSGATFAEATKALRTIGTVDIITLAVAQA